MRSSGTKAGLLGSSKRWPSSRPQCSTYLYLTLPTLFLPPADGAAGAGAAGAGNAKAGHAIGSDPRPIFNLSHANLKLGEEREEKPTPSLMDPISQFPLATTKIGDVVEASDTDCLSASLTSHLLAFHASFDLLVDCPDCPGLS